MEMTDEEIRRSYRLAKYPTKHIEELAELNACDCDRIREIVKDVVPNVGTKAPKPHPTRGMTKAEIEATYSQRNALLLEKYLQGLNDSDIGQACGVSQNMVRHWRNRAGLRPNYSRRKDD